jgi:hypothetical protein
MSSLQANVETKLQKITKILLPSWEEVPRSKVDKQLEIDQEQPTIEQLKVEQEQLEVEQQVEFFF